MKFDSKQTDQEIKEGGFSLLPEGDYDAEVLECEETESKKGDPMFKVTLGIKEGEQRYKVWDYLSPCWFQEKFRSFFESMGKLDMYESGDIDPAMLIHQYVTASIEIQAGKGAYEGQQNNVVAMYIPAEVNAAKKVFPKVLEEVKNDDGLPFTFLAPLVPFLVAIGGIVATMRT